MKRSPVIIAALMVSGCAAGPRPIDVQTQVVDKAVPVACIDPAKVPVEPAATPSLPADARQAADILGVVDKSLRAWGHGLMALIKPCTQ